MTTEKGKKDFSSNKIQIWLLKSQRMFNYRSESTAPLGNTITFDSMGFLPELQVNVKLCQLVKVYCFAKTL